MGVPGRLADRRVLLTHPDRYVGPAITRLFEAEGATVMPVETALDSIEAAQQMVADARLRRRPGRQPRRARRHVRATEIDDAGWTACFDVLVPRARALETGTKCVRDPEREHAEEDPRGCCGSAAPAMMSTCGSV